jgi:hypothetical protein
MFDSINHLTSFAKWSNTFRQTAKHLSPNGLFIFDINPLERFYGSIPYPPFAMKVGKDFMLFKANKTKKKNTVQLHYQFFIHKKGNSYLYAQERFFESSYDVEKVKKSLNKYFTIEEVYTVSNTKKHGWPSRIFFVCKKR